MIAFNFDNQRPIYIQLVEQLELAIISGRIPPGERLPAVRELALAAHVNPNTMQKALAELETLKLIHTERTNGKYVTNDTEHIARSLDRFIDARVDDFIDDMQALGIKKRDLFRIIKKYGGK